ncbi:peptidoglycan-binding domain-containing protein, partial [Paradevosia shaoguanensis]
VQQRAAEPAPQQVASLQAPANAVSSTDPQLVAKVQRGLASLGFLAGSVDGVPGEATAKAIRNFEVYYNYDVTGKVTPQLVDMLTAAGAVI